METVTIRDAVIDDIDDVLRVTERSWNVAYSDILSEETIDTTMKTLYEGGATARLIEREDTAFFVAERNGIIVGFISGAPSDEEDVALLGALYVHPDYWNEGIGTALLREFEAFCHRRGDERIEFHVLSENEIGMSFYRKHGYSVIDERETDRFEDPATECVFRGDVQ